MNTNTSLYPSWHEQPHTLTLNEISNPATVIEEFCWQYSVSEARLILKEWYAASLSDEAADTRNIFTFYETIEKLIEAIYVMNQKLHNLSSEK